MIWFDKTKTRNRGRRTSVFPFFFLQTLPSFHFRLPPVSPPFLRVAGPRLFSEDLLSAFSFSSAKCLETCSFFDPSIETIFFSSSLRIRLLSVFMPSSLSSFCVSSFFFFSSSRSPEHLASAPLTSTWTQSSLIFSSCFLFTPPPPPCSRGAIDKRPLLLGRNVILEQAVFSFFLFAPLLSFPVLDQRARRSPPSCLLRACRCAFLPLKSSCPWEAIPRWCFA